MSTIDTQDPRATRLPSYRDIDRLEIARDAAGLLLAVAGIDAAHRRYVTRHNASTGGGGFSGQQVAHVCSLRRRHRYALAAAERMEATP